MFKDVYRREFSNIQPDEKFLERLSDAAVRMSSNRHHSVSRRLVIPVAAILVLLLSATAVAVVQGKLLHSKIAGSGAEDFAEQVQDIHVADASDGFSLMIDEVVWEDGRLYLSYSATAPDDSKTYLLALNTPSLNGSRMVASRPVFIDDYMGQLIALGGDYPNNASGVLGFDWISTALKDNPTNRIILSGTFLEAQWPIEAIKSGDIWEEFDNSGRVLRGFAKDGQLYLQPWQYPEVQSIMQEDNVDELNAQIVAKAGMGTIAAERRLEIGLDASDMDETVVRHLAQERFEMDGYTAEIRQFSLSHTGAACVFRIYREGGVNYDASKAPALGNPIITNPLEGDPLARFYALLRTDGSPLSDGSTSSTYAAVRLDDGSYALEITCTAEGIIPLEKLDQLLLVPQGDGVDYIMDEAITLTLNKD